ncbi:hypothetical protein QM285_22365, partial [Stutzerimonas stutzeri]|nr:hypothetical protein [Stutzerimonas stutzeri]
MTDAVQERVLLVEDDDSLRQLLVEELEDRGLQVRALASARTCSPRSSSSSTSSWRRLSSSSTSSTRSCTASVMILLLAQWQRDAKCRTRQPAVDQLDTPAALADHPMGHSQAQA